MKNAKVVLNFNEKGGVGKTTTTGLFLYLLAHRGYKVLGIDLDPQHNLTDMIASTYRDGKHFHPIMELGKAIENDNLKSAICNAGKNIDIAPSSLALIHFQPWDNGIGIPERYKIVNETLKPFQHKYDFIFIDVPPTFNPYSINAIYAAKYISLIVQTQKSSYTSSLDTVNMLGYFHDKYGFKFNLLGVVLYLMINAKEDKITTNKAEKVFGDFIYKDRIRYQERVKGFTDSGIKDKDYWDKRSIGMYSKLLNDMLKRIEADE